jgi:hypothetical protein
MKIDGKIVDVLGKYVLALQTACELISSGQAVEFKILGKTREEVFCLLMESALKNWDSVEGQQLKSILLEVVTAIAYEEGSPQHQAEPGPVEATIGIHLAQRPAPTLPPPLPAEPA